MSRPTGDVLASGRLLRAHQGRVQSLLPHVPAAVLATWSVSAADALSLHQVIGAFDTQLDVLEIGTFLGTSAYVMAAHPAVRTVISVDPNPVVEDEINSTGMALGAAVSGRSGRHVHDVAREALLADRTAADKVALVEGVVGRLPGGPEPVDLATLLPSPPDAPLLVLIDGLHDGPAVAADVRAVLTHRPDALVLLDDCRHHWGPFVQSGIADVLSAEPGRWIFRLLADLSAGLASTSFGVLHAATSDGSVPPVLAEVVRRFGTDLDPSSLLERQAQLIQSVSRARAEDAASLAATLADHALDRERARRRVEHLETVVIDQEAELAVRRAVPDEPEFDPAYVRELCDVIALRDRELAEVRAVLEIREHQLSAAPAAPAAAPETPPGRRSHPLRSVAARVRGNR